MQGAFSSASNGFFQKNPEALLHGPVEDTCLPEPAAKGKALGHGADVGLCCPPSCHALLPV